MSTATTSNWTFARSTKWSFIKFNKPIAHGVETNFIRGYCDVFDRSNVTQASGKPEPPLRMGVEESTPTARTTQEKLSVRSTCGFSGYPLENACEFKWSKAYYAAAKLLATNHFYLVRCKRCLTWGENLFEKQNISSKLFIKIRRRLRAKIQTTVNHYKV